MTDSTPENEASSSAHETTDTPSSAASAPSVGSVKASAPPDATASDEEPPRRPAHRFRWSTKKTVAAVVIGLALIVGVGGVVYAGHSDSSGKAESGHEQNNSSIGPDGEDSTTLWPAALHGEFVIFDVGNGYVTKFTQIGVVTDSDSNSLTVKSADGYTKTYALGSDTAEPQDDPADDPKQDSFVKDDTVTVRATLSGDKVTAESIMKLDEAQPDFQGRLLDQLPPSGEDGQR